MNLTALRLAKKGWKVTAIDSDSSVLDHLKQFIEEYKVNQVMLPEEFEEDLKTFPGYPNIAAKQKEALREQFLTAKIMAKTLQRQGVKGVRVGTLKHEKRRALSNRKNSTVQRRKRHPQREARANPPSPKLNFLNKKIEDYPFQDEQVDMVYAFSSLPYTDPKDFPEIWERIHRAIKPNGILIGNFFTPAAVPLSPLNIIANRMGVWRVNKAAVRILLIQKGYKIERFEEKKSGRFLPGEIHFAARKLANSQNTSKEYFFYC